MVKLDEEHGAIFAEELKKASDSVLADLLEIAVLGKESPLIEELKIKPWDVNVLAGCDHLIRREARDRKLEEAVASSDAEWEVFAAKLGHTTESLNALDPAEIDAIYDTVPDGDFPAGEWKHLVDALRR